MLFIFIFLIKEIVMNSDLVLSIISYTSFFSKFFFYSDKKVFFLQLAKVDTKYHNLIRNY